MGEKFIKGLIFAAGVVTGVAASAYYFKAKYERIAAEQNAATRLYFKNKYESNNEQEAESEIIEEDNSDEPEVEIKKEDYNKYSNMLSELGYNKKEEDKKDMKRPYIIDLDEYENRPDYEALTLSVYADGIVTDENDEPINDVRYFIDDALDDLGDDPIYVRNDDLKKDFELIPYDMPYYDED